MDSGGAAHDGNDGSIILVGYSAAVLRYLSKYLPDNSVVFIDEPDIMRKRDAVTVTAEIPTLRELIEWEFYELDGTADSFYNAHRQLRPAAVVPISDYGVPFAARLAERYGVVGAGYGAARLLRDKELLRVVTRAGGIPNPESVAVNGPADVRAFMAEIGGPVVIKPANRQGAIGTKIVREADEIEASWLECLEQDEGAFMPDRALPLRMLAERYVRGEEFSVEMMLHKGRPAFGAVTRTLLFDGPRPVEQGHLHPADISPELTKRLLADTARVLEVIGMDSGFTHCEWRVEDGVPHLMECAGRMAGDGIIELVVMAWDYDIVGQFYDMMQGREFTQTPPAVAPRYAAVWLSAAAPGELESVDGLEEALALPGVHGCVLIAKVGGKVHALHSSFDRVAQATAEGATPAEALASAQAAINRITVKVRPADQA